MPDKLVHKNFNIEELKVEVKKDDNEKESTYITGYANTKGKEDAYGDIPTNYKGKPVYDVSRMKTNPVMLIDHENSITRIMGNFVKLKEDDKGLFFKVKLKNIEDSFLPEVKEAISNFKSGVGRALSVGGKWLYENEGKPKQLTKAIIHEISGVGVGADGFALSDAEKIKSLSKTTKDENLEEVEGLKSKYGVSKTEEVLKSIEKQKEEIKNNE